MKDIYVYLGVIHNL